MARSKFLAVVAGGLAIGAVLGAFAQEQQPAPAVDTGNPAVFAAGLPVGTRAPAFDVTNVVTGETLCYV